MNVSKGPVELILEEFLSLTKDKYKRRSQGIVWQPLDPKWCNHKWQTMFKESGLFLDLPA